MTSSLKFPNAYRPCHESFPDGFPVSTQTGSSVSEMSDIIYSSQPLIACSLSHPNRPLRKDSLDEQRHETLSQHAPEQMFQPAPAKVFAVFQPGHDSYDPWNETEGLGSHDQLF